MKTQIIQLEVHDDTNSVKDKMDWSQTPRILLVWPDRGKVFQKRLDLVLLERYCSSHGSQLALLSSDPEVIFLAEEAGIPVFQSRRNAQTQPWRKSFREFERKDLYQQVGEPREIDFFERTDTPKPIEFPAWGRILIFTIGVLAVLSIAGLLLPSAVVTIPEEGKTRNLKIPIQADPNLKNVNISGIIPARKMVLTIEAEKSRPTSGSLAVPEEYAGGEVVFTNLSETSISIPKNSVLSTTSEDSVLFVTLDPGQTPEGKGAQITIEVRALEAGSSGNVDAGEINRINQAFGADLSVTNLAPTIGGIDINVPAPSQTDITILTSSLMAELEQNALEEFQGKLKEGDVLFGSSLDVIDIENETSIPEPGFAGDSLTISKSVKYGILYVTREDLISLANDISNAQYHEGDFEKIPGSLTIDYSDPPDLQTEWFLNMEWEEKKSVYPVEIIQLALGKKSTDAVFTIQSRLESTYPPEIKIKPGWWFRLPVLPFRINVIEEGIQIQND